MDSTQKSSIDNNKNLLFADQRNLTENTSRLGCSLVSPQVAMKMSMPEDAWTFETAACRPIPLGLTAWSNVAAGTTLTTMKIPSDAYSSNSYLVNILRVITYFRCDVKIRIQLNSTRFHQGLALAYYIPLRLRAVAPNSFSTDFGQHLYNCLLFPHAYLDASQGTDAEIIIPFQHIQTFLDLTENVSITEGDLQKQFMGILYVDVLSQLKFAGTTSSVIYFTTWMQPVNPKLHLVVNDHVLPVAQGLEGALEEIPAVAQHVLSGISNVAAGNVSQAYVDAQSVYQGVKTVYDNLDNPADPFKPACVLSSGGEMASSDGKDASIRLSLGAASVTKHPQELLCEPEAELKVSNIARLPTILDVLSGMWSTSTAAGTKIGQYYVHPCNSRYGAEIPYGTPTASHKKVYLDPTNLSAIASRFCFWSGSIVFSVRVVSTIFHTGRLRLVFFPNTQAPLSFAFTNSYPMIVFDIAEEKVIRFTIPYNSATPWKRTANYADYTTALPSPRFHLGVFALYVQNLLVAPGTVASSVDLVIEISGGSDFRVAVPAAPSCFGKPGSYGIQQQFFSPTDVPFLTVDRVRRGLAKINYPAGTKSSDEADAQADEPVASVELDRKQVYNSLDPNPIFTVQKPIQNLFGFMNGEEFDNLKDVMKRYAMIDIINPLLNNTNTDTFAYDLPIMPMYPIYTQNDQFLAAPGVNGGSYEIGLSDNFSYFTSLYAFWRGSMRYKFVSNFSKNIGGVSYASHQPDVYFTLSNAGTFTNATPWYLLANRRTYTANTFPPNAFSCYATQFENLSTTGSMNVEAPYTSPFLSLPTFWYWFNDSDTGLPIWMDTEALTTGTLEYGVCTNYVSASTPPAPYDFQSSYVCVFHAAGDDFMPYWYIGPMTITLYVGEIPPSPS